ncbi:MAG: superoxide dismutase [Rickettsiales bacterium]|nr:superoxide dismutase [Rickettsiales bacterium]
MNRREFLTFSAPVLAFMAGFASIIGSPSLSYAFNGNKKSSNYPFLLPKLPFKPNDLEPYISSKTIDFHYNKHHKTYIDNLNNLVKGTEFEQYSLEQIIIKTFGKKDYISVFNNAAQAWNHNFFWHSMNKNAGGKPSEKLLGKIEKDFGSFDNFRKLFFEEATKKFGSGWCWMVLTSNKKLAIRTTGNAELPQVFGEIPLLTLDLWEHSYYLDYQNRRSDYVNVFLDKLVNWSLADRIVETTTKI